MERSYLGSSISLNVLSKWAVLLTVISSYAVGLAREFLKCVGGMGAQQAKERGTASGASMRSSRNKPRAPKDPRMLGSNIFTEHSGEYNI